MKHQHMVKSNKNAKSLHPAVQYGMIQKFSEFWPACRYFSQQLTTVVRIYCLFWFSADSARRADSLLCYLSEYYVWFFKDTRFQVPVQ